MQQKKKKCLWVHHLHYNVIHKYSKLAVDIWGKKKNDFSHQIKHQMISYWTEVYSYKKILNIIVFNTYKYVKISLRISYYLIHTCFVSFNNYDNSNYTIHI